MLPLSEAGRAWLLALARDALMAAARGEAFEPPDPPFYLAAADREELQRKRCAFVTLHFQGKLRGCVGHTLSDNPLRVVVADMASAGALEDSRFPPVIPEEVPGIEIEISVLSAFFPIAPEQIVPGLHGLFVRRGFCRGLLLPQVAEIYRWDGMRLLQETCRKAGLSPDAWQHGATVEAFTADLLSEPAAGR